MQTMTRWMLTTLVAAMLLLAAVAAQAADCPKGQIWNPKANKCITPGGGGGGGQKPSQPSQPSQPQQPAQPKGKSPSCSQALANCNSVCAQQYGAHRNAAAYQTCINNCQIGFNYCQ